VVERFVRTATRGRKRRRRETRRYRDDDEGEALPICNSRFAILDLQFTTLYPRFLIYSREASTKAPALSQTREQSQATGAPLDEPERDPLTLQALALNRNELRRDPRAQAQSARGTRESPRQYSPGQDKCRLRACASRHQTAVCKNFA